MDEPLFGSAVPDETPICKEELPDPIDSSAVEPKCESTTDASREVTTVDPSPPIAVKGEPDDDVPMPPMDDVALPSMDTLPAEAEGVAEEEGKRKRSRPSVPQKPPPGLDIRAMFAASKVANAERKASGTETGGITFIPGAGVAIENGSTSNTTVNNKLEAFKLKLSSHQKISEETLMPAAEGHAVMAGQAKIKNAGDIVPLLVAPVPLLLAGEAILKQLPQEFWLDFAGRSDALGTRCLFASRRHEHSVFKHMEPGEMLRVPLAVQQWQPAMKLQCQTALAQCFPLADQPAWIVEVHPGRKALRVSVRPGVNLLQILRNGSAIPDASFSWRVIDSNEQPQEPAQEAACGAQPLGEFMILSNIEDAAYTQPPRFEQWPLRREQLRSLGWMVSQEQKRAEPFITELRSTTHCPDAPHWRLECALRCEYTGVKGGVLADAIGYGKTACTIGLVDCTHGQPKPVVPATFAGFIPSKATLVLAPTNLHTQWLNEIKKFTGDALKVLSVPTCVQLKRLTSRDLAEADIVVATYRLFYSSAYLRRLSEVARSQKPDFKFSRMPGDENKKSRRQTGLSAANQDFAKSYQLAFEALPSWAAKLQEQYREADDSTPWKGVDQAELNETPVRPVRRQRGKTATAFKEELLTQAAAKEQSQEVLVVGGMSKRRRLKKKQAAAEPSVEGAVPDAFVPLEAFWWRRVVCDEFHELLSRYPPAQVAVELFHADYKWGLSGTPPCQTLAQIRKAAGFLGVQLPVSADTEGPRKVAQEWLDAFARRNTAELPAYDEQEAIVPVHQTAKERALYMALTAHTRFDGVKEEEVEGNEDSIMVETQGAFTSLAQAQNLRAECHDVSGLLKLCSHFCISGREGVNSAEDEVNAQLSLRRSKAEAVERQAKALAERAAGQVRMVRHFEPHYCRTPRRSDYSYILQETKTAIAARLRFFGDDGNGTKNELLERLLGPKGSENHVDSLAASAAEKVKEVALGADFHGKRSALAAKSLKDAEITWATFEARASNGLGDNAVVNAVQVALSALGEDRGYCVQPPNQRCSRLRANLGMPKWVTSGDGESRQDFEEADLAWWRQPGNSMKLRKVLDAWKDDIDICVQHLSTLETEAATRHKQLQSFEESWQASQIEIAMPDPTMTDIDSATYFAKYGSKIEALVKHVQRVQSEDPFCKIICFVQWEDLKKKIGSALKEFGVEHVSLQGGVWLRRNTLMKFQYEELKSPRMLLLSLEESASGTNLTAANHVIIVHPMEAASKEEAVAFEMQAIGRVRRPGQKRKIFIWRFVTMGTIEQKITEEHQKELWERQQVNITCSQPALYGENDLDSEGLDEEEANEDLVFEQESQSKNLMDLSTQLYTAADISILDVKDEDMEGGMDSVKQDSVKQELAGIDGEDASADVDGFMAAQETLGYDTFALLQDTLNPFDLGDDDTQVY